MAVRLTWGRLGLRSVVSLSEPAMARLFSSGGSGGVLHEEEKAAENIYFKKKDKERLDSIAQKAIKQEEKPKQDVETSGVSEQVKDKK